MSSSGLTFKSLIGSIVGLIAQMVPYVISLGVLFFLYGIVRYVMSRGDTKELKEGRNFMFFGIIGLFVMIAMWALAGVISQTFLGVNPSNNYVTPYSTSSGAPTSVSATGAGDRPRTPVFPGSI